MRKASNDTTQRSHFFRLDDFFLRPLQAVECFLQGVGALFDAQLQVAIGIGEVQIARFELCHQIAQGLARSVQTVCKGAHLVVEYPVDGNIQLAFFNAL